MGKPSKRPARAAREIHERIREAAETLRNASTFGVRDAEEFPEIAELLTACKKILEAGIPRSVVFEGRTYWLSVRLAAMFDIYASPGETRPLIRGASFSFEEFGHRPGH